MAIFNITFTGGTVTGTSSDDIILDKAANTVEAGSGNDIIMGDAAYFLVDNTGANNSVASAMSLDGTWTTQANPLIANDAVPHITVVGDGADQRAFYSVTVAAGATLTADIDFGAGAPTGGNFDSSLTFLNASAQILAANNNTAALDTGSYSTLDANLSWTNSTGNAAVVNIAVQQSGGLIIPTGAQYLLNVSVTDYPTVAVTEPSTGTSINGNNGNDYIVGFAGDDSLNGSADNDTLYGGLGSDSVKGGTGNDILYSSNGSFVFVDGQQDTLRGEDGNDTLHYEMERVTSTSTFNFNGGAGADTAVINLWAMENVIVDLGLENVVIDNVQFGILRDFENATVYGTTRLRGSDEANTLRAIGNGDNRMFGRDGNDIILAGAGNDIIFDEGGNDTSYGEAGNDFITGDIGNDRAEGGADNDTLYGEGGIDTLLGGTGNDEIRGGSGADSLDGGDGIDTLDYFTDTAGVTVALFNNTASGGDATGDIISGFENILGGSGNDRLTGSVAQANLILGYGGNDVLYGASGNNTLQGGDGNDTIYGNTGAESLDGGDGTDTLNYFLDSAGVTVALWNETASGGIAQGDTISGFENVVGGTGNDRLAGAGDQNNGLFGGAGNDTLFGATGDNTLQGGGGNDVIFGNIGAEDLDGGTGTDLLSYSTDTAGVTVALWNSTASGGNAQGDTIANFENVTGGSGNDRLSGAGSENNILTGLGGDDILFGATGNNTLRGGDGNDTIYGNTGAELLEGGAGIDVLNYVTDTTGVTVSLATSTASRGRAEGDIISGFEQVVGGSGADRLNGKNNENNVLSGNGGNDVLFGATGNNTLLGGAGNDTIFGNSGAEVLDGDTGVDLLNYSADTLGVTVSLWNREVSGGHAQGDTISGFENVTGGSGNDRLTGSAGVNNLLIGGGGNDVLYGASGNNTLQGGNGDDTIFGNAGAELLEGGDGNDVLNYVTDTAGVTVSLAASTATGGHATGDIITGFENVIGGTGNDRLTGSSNVDNLMVGQAGNDTLNGLSGDDTLTGGAGDDVFSFSDTFERDVITDFGIGNDQARVFGTGTGFNQFSDFDVNNNGIIDVADANLTNKVSLSNGDMTLFFNAAQTLSVTFEDIASMGAADISFF